MKVRSRRRLVHVAMTILAICAMIASALFIPQHAAAQPAFDFSPRSGPPGTSVEVTVTGAPSGEDLTVLGNGEPLCSFTTERNGGGGCAFTVPERSRNIALEITGPNVARSDIGTFRVTEPSESEVRVPDASRGPLDILDCSTAAIRNLITRNPLEVPQTLLDCRLLTPDYRPASPEVEKLIEDLGCVGALLSLSQLAARSAGGLLGSGLSAVQVGLCLAKEMEEADRAFLERHGGSFAPIEELAPLPTTPIELPGHANMAPTASEPVTIPDLLPAPVVPSAPANVAEQNAQIREALAAPVSAPSAELVRNQHADIRAEVCASLPETLGGCS